MIAAQFALALPVPPRPEPDYPALARAELVQALALAEGAVDQPPWPYRDQRMWRVLFPQMSGWLPDDERADLLGRFMPALDRIETLFGKAS